MPICVYAGAVSTQTNSVGSDGKEFSTFPRASPILVKVQSCLHFSSIIDVAVNTHVWNCQSVIEVNT